MRLFEMIEKLSDEDSKSITISRSSGSLNDAIFDSFPQNIKSIIATLRVVVDQIDSDFKRARELILEIARQLDEKKLCERNQISRTIKKILKDKIHEGKVTEKWIEECLAPEYKRQYTKSEPSSLSKQQQKQQIVEVSTIPSNKESTNKLKQSFSKPSEQKPQQQITGKSDIMNDTSTKTEAQPISSGGVNQPHNQYKQNGIGTDDNNEEGIADPKEESKLTHSLNNETTSVNKQNKDLTDRKKKMFLSHIPVSFIDLQKDMDAVSQITNEVGNIFFEVSVDLGASEVEIKFCGITQQKNATMTSTGKGVLQETK
jgi:hypothetical protein